MTDYTELIRSLRCENTGDDECGSSDCPYWSGLGCMDGQLMEDAADAIEALQDDMKTYGKTAYDEGYAIGFAAGENKAEKQLPKRGEWIWDDKRCIYVCSVCGSPKVRENMDRQIIKEQAYCYSCGAKMNGEQNVE